MASSEQNEFIVFVELDTGVRLDISNDIVQEVERTVRDFGPVKGTLSKMCRPKWKDGLPRCM
jgi:hypothetical protein